MMRGEPPAAHRLGVSKSIVSRRLIARSYLATLAHNVRKGKGSIKTYKKVKWMLEAFIFPALGHRPIIAMRSAELLVKCSGMRSASVT
jgi:hypothetical protein